MARDPIVQTISGIVASVHGTGFRLRDREGFLNLSKFCDPEPVLPNPGDAVVVGLDKGGFVRQVQFARDTPPQNGASIRTELEAAEMPEKAPAPREQTASAAEPPHPAIATYSAPQAQPVAPSRPDFRPADLISLRLGVLDTALRLLSAAEQPPDITALLQTAARLEQWVLR